MRNNLGVQNRDEQSSIGCFGQFCQPKMVQSLMQSIMWVQREKVFSRWKERVVVITQDYLQCFKKGSAQLSNVAHFLLKVECSSTYRKQYQIKEIKL